MTGSHAGGHDAHRSVRRPLVWRVGTPLVALACGALFLISAADSGGTDLRPGRYTDLAGLAKAEADDVERLQREARALREEVERLSEDVSSGGVSRFRGEIAQLEDPAGLEPREGPGVTIRLSDAPEELLEAALERGELDGEPVDGNRFVVHQQDLQAVVNALWLGGAEAVTIAGQRIVSTTGIKCEGPVVQLQGFPYPQPFRIQAVGDPEELVAAVTSDPYVAGYLADAAHPEIRIGWSMQTEEHVVAPAYDGVLEVSYAQPIR